MFKNGNFYGTTSAGALGNGTVFRYSLRSGLQTLHRFTGGNDGATPLAALTVAFDCTLYGTASSGSANGLGNIFRINANGFTRRYQFGGRDGASPQGKLVDGLDGNLYGTTHDGGANGLGEIFAIAQ